jgi:penicillin-binding protein 1A
LATKTAPRRTNRKHSAKSSPKRKKKRGFFRRFWWLWATPVVVAIATFSALGYVYSKLPLDLDIPEAQSTFLFDRDGAVLTTFDKGVDRRKVELKTVPDHLVQAVLAAEDERFFRHGGVSLLAIIRATIANVTGGEIEQGGSTITQQYVRNVFPEVGTERTVTRKIKEVLLAIKLEQKLSKNDILERYLNTIYLGEGAYGVEAAAQTYFSTHARNLNLVESATLAGLISGPETFNPIDSKGDAVARRNYVLDRMAELGFISPSEAASLSNEPMKVVPRNSSYKGKPGAYYIDYARQWLQSRFHGRTYRGGLRVRGTLDSQWQRIAEHAIQNHLSLKPGTPVGSLVAVDVDTGEVRAMVGGPGFTKSQVNLATGEGGTGRQAGSAFKPFTLAAAIEENISLHSTFAGPSEVDMSDDGCEAWKPSNFDDTSYGTMDLVSATVSSVNTIFAQLVVEVGPENVADVAHRMGIRSPLEDKSGFVPCSITLGTKEVTPLEMAQAFATFASGGIRRVAVPAHVVRGSEGEVLWPENRKPDKPPVGKQVIEPNTAWQAVAAMEGVLTGGTAAGNFPGFPSFGKTGTTDDLADVWFCGASSEVATCVWIGHPEGRVEMPGFSGGSHAAPIWREFMVAIHEELDPQPFPDPEFSGSLIQGTIAPPPPPSPVPTETPTEEPTEEPSPRPTETDIPTPDPTGTGGGGGGGGRGRGGGG